MFVGDCLNQGWLSSQESIPGRLSVKEPVSINPSLFHILSTMLRSLLPRITRIASPNIPTRGLHASALRPAMNIAQHDIFDAMGIRTDPAIARPIDRVDSDGFGVAGISVKGPVVVLGGKVFLWDVPQFGSAKTEGGVEGPGLFEGWNEEMLAVFEVLESPPGLFDWVGRTSNPR